MQITKHNLIVFLFGIICGVVCALSMIYHNELRNYYTIRMTPGISAVEEKAIDGKNNTTDKSELGRKSPITGTDNSTAIELYENVRVLCWVMTSPATLRSKAKSVKETWTKRCNIRLFMSSVEDKDFPAVGLPVQEGRAHLYEKTKEAFKYVWERHRDEADWFMKADDDTYVIVENLRFLLKDYDTNSPLYFGRRFKPFVKQGFMSGGAGYVLSKEALKRYYFRFVEGIDSEKCAKGGVMEDVEIGKCLSVVGVEAMDSRDDSKKETFHPLNPSLHLTEGSVPKYSWLWKYIYYPSCLGPTCISNYPISFHYVSQQEMYNFDYMIYNVKTYGVSYFHPKFENSKSNRTN